MQQTSNTFLKGLNSDMHPLTTSQQEYIDALNATLITYNGNEQMLQNDMGNTRIQDAKTGNIMGLREGFIPLGIKEHGGIMYIASINKEGKGEIGTIPSPVIKYNQKKYIKPQDFTYQSENEIYTSKSELFKLIDDDKVNTGEKFVVVLDTRIPQDTQNNETEENKQNTGKVSFKCRTINGGEKTLEYDLFTKRDSKWKPIYGVYKIGLYSQTDDQVFDLNKLTEQKYDYYTK